MFELLINYQLEIKMANEIDEKRRIAGIILSSDVGTMLSPETEKMLARVDESVTNVKETVQEVNDALNTTKEIVDNVTVLWNCTLDTVKAVKELDVIMKQMDITLDKYLQDTNVSLEKFKTSAPIIESQIDKISERIDKILDSALKIDSKNCDMIDLELRSKLISQVRTWSDHISDMLMKLMGI